MNYIAVNGTKFSLNGFPWVPFGGTVYNGSDSNHDWPTSWPDYFVAQAVLGGFTMVRFTAFLPFPHNETTDVYKESTWVGIDYALNKCLTNGIKVVLDLSDYGNVLLGAGTNCYTADWTTFIQFVANRVNTINGRVYKNDDTIWLVDLKGEAHTSDLAGLTTSQITSLYQNMGPVLKTNFPNHLISPGGFNHLPNTDQNPNYQTIWALSCFDVVAIHPYSTSQSNGILSSSQWTTVGNVATSVNKPLLMEEIGINQSWDDKYRMNLLKEVHNRCVAVGGTGFVQWNMGGVEASTSFNFDPTNNPAVFAIMKKFNSDDRIPRLPVY